MARKTTLSKLAEPVVIYPQVLVNVKVKNKDAAVNDPYVRSAVERAESKLSSGGRMLLRQSGTEPLVRVMAEAESEELCRECIKIVVDAIEMKGHIIK